MSNYIFTQISVSTGKTYSIRCFSMNEALSYFRTPYVYRAYITRVSDGVILAEKYPETMALRMCDSADYKREVRDYDDWKTNNLRNDLPIEVITNEDFALDLYARIQKETAKFHLESAHDAIHRGTSEDHAWSLHAYTAASNAARAAKCALDYIKYPHLAGLPVTFNRFDHNPMWRG